VFPLHVGGNFHEEDRCFAALRIERSAPWKRAGTAPRSILQPSFVEKLGVKRVGMLRDAPIGSSEIFLRKSKIDRSDQLRVPNLTRADYFCKANNRTINQTIVTCKHCSSASVPDCDRLFFRSIRFMSEILKRIMSKLDYRVNWRISSWHRTTNKTVTRGVLRIILRGR